MAIGEYILENIPPGTYTVTATMDGYITQYITAEVAADMTTTVDFQLAKEKPPVGTISGIVTDNDTGLPISGIKIAVNGYSTFTE